MKKFLVQSAQRMLIVAPITFLLLVSAPACSQTDNYEFNDSHFHLTNNIQEGPNIHEFLNMMGTKAGRVAIFGVPLQQQWSYRTDGDRAPTYYLNTDAPLYYYSFTDASIAMAYKSLAKEQQARFDPMITGFNPTDMYAADHIRRVLETFPGVFTGIGEFVVHKEFTNAREHARERLEHSADMIRRIHVRWVEAGDHGIKTRLLLFGQRLICHGN